jgi:biopolymer transport protein ExbB
MTSPMRKSLQAALLMAVLALPLAWVAARAAEAPPAPPAAGGVERKKSMILGEGDTLWDLFKKGGICMWPILINSVVGLAFFFERLIELRKKKHIPKNFDKELVMAVDTRGVDAGLALCLERTSSLARVLYAALLRYGTSRQEMEAAIQDEGARMLYDLRRNCRVIGIMSNTAPLWGLLGTVQGLIMAFDQVAAAGALGRTESLATGVAVALLTTAWGLLVAIPLQIAYFFTKGKADDLAREIEERAVDAVVTLDRKARRSIRQIEDVEENLETKTMAAAKQPPSDLDSQFEDRDLEKAIKTSVTTPPQLIVPQSPAKTPSSDKLEAPTPPHGSPPAGTERR